MSSAEAPSGRDKCFFYILLNIAQGENVCTVLHFVLIFQGSFPTLLNRSSNFQLPASVTPLDKRTYTGTIVNQLGQALLIWFDIAWFELDNKHLLVVVVQSVIISHLMEKLLGIAAINRFWLLTLVGNPALLRDDWPGDGRVGQAEAPLPQPRRRQDPQLRGHPRPQNMQGDDDDDDDDDRPQNMHSGQKHAEHGREYHTLS